MSESDTAIAAAYVAACLGELDALKPGNAHRFAPHPRMEVVDFELSAEASAPHVARRGARVGQRIRAAVGATLAAVGHNTNLGILILCAPLAAAAERRAPSLRAALDDVLDGLTREDAADAFAAIAAANPGGLGSAARHDVRAPATVTLSEAMREAADRDRIARQDVDGFADVFALGLTALVFARAAGFSPRWATASVYLAFLAEFPDSHVARKFGAATAEATRREAAEWRDRLAAAPEPDSLIDDLLAWDAALKARAINPGTSADLTVATLFAAALCGS